jgi:hypothetical protein
MSNGLALALGTVLAVGALAYVLYPLFFRMADPERSGPAVTRAPEESAIRALREIEFDRATGKLSDTDYQELRAMYAPRALAELRGDDGSTGTGGTTGAADLAVGDIEERIRAYRAARPECDRCGLRPEPDAIYCSTCGGYLGAACPSCRSPVTEPSAAFCSACGSALAAPQPA